MNKYTFTILLDRAPTDDESDALYDAGLDGNVIQGNGCGSFMVTQPAETLDEAILAVIDCLRELGLMPVGIENDDLVNIADIARRTGRTHESVRLLAAGKRGLGGFPAPVTGELYSWEQVRRWFTDYEGASPAYDAEDATLAAADLFLRAKVLRPDAGRLVHLVV